MKRDAFPRKSGKICILLVSCKRKLCASFVIRGYQCQKSTICIVSMKKFGHFEGKVREDEFSHLKSVLQRQQNLFTMANKSSEAEVKQVLL